LITKLNAEEYLSRDTSHNKPFQDSFLPATGGKTLSYCYELIIQAQERILSAILFGDCNRGRDLLLRFSHQQR
jgi:hypothetical protein